MLTKEINKSIKIMKKKIMNIYKMKVESFIVLLLCLCPWARYLISICFVDQSVSGTCRLWGILQSKCWQGITLKCSANQGVYRPGKK